MGIGVVTFFEKARVKMTTKHATDATESSELHALRSTSVASEEVPIRVMLAPWGTVESTNGSFVVDEESGRLILAAFEEHGTDLPIDYEHQTLGGAYASPSGQAPAAGWIKRIVLEDGIGVFADIEWTAQAASLLSSKQYRYLSPVAIIRKSDRKLIAIHSAALTNKPAIIGMEAIVNRDSPPLPPEMTSWDALREELALDDNAKTETVLLAAGRRIRELEDAARMRCAGERVQEAMRAGKLVEAQRSWAESLVAREEELFDQWFRTAPVIVAPGAFAAPSEGQACKWRLSSVESKSRAEFRANSMLSGLTSEQAYVDDALRRAAG